MGKIKWTEEDLREEASKYDRKIDFQEGSYGAYRACHRRFPHIIEEMFFDRLWDEERLREEASKYDRKIDFKNGSNGAYQACHRGFKHILEEMFFDRLWDEERLREEASKYDRKIDFQNGSRGAYLACLRRFKHILYEMFDNPYISWDEESIREAASKCDTKKDFVMGYNNAYQVCRRRFRHILDEMFENQSTASSYDVAYLWRSSNHWWKFGVTSLRLGDQRIHQVRANSGTEIEEMYMWHMDNALSYEMFMKDLGERLPPSDKFSGHTECRYLFDWEVEQAIRQGDSMGDRIEVQ